MGFVSPHPRVLIRGAWMPAFCTSQLFTEAARSSESMDIVGVSSGIQGVLQDLGAKVTGLHSTVKMTTAVIGAKAYAWHVGESREIVGTGCR
jgi:hypothetical protein